MPVACINAKQIVGPTKENPRFFKSLLMAVDSAVDAGTSACVAQSFNIGRPPTKRQIYAAKLPNSYCTSKKARAFVTKDLILRLLLIILLIYRHSLIFIVY